MTTDDELIAVVFRKWVDQHKDKPTTREDDMWQAFQAGWRLREIANRPHWKDFCGNE